MENILVICAHNQIDAALQKSLVHLAKSFQVEVVFDGDEAFDKISGQIFDLIVIDFLLPGYDALDLVESFHYIDPEVPIILMLEPVHKAALVGLSHLRTRLIERPFTAIQFLRLADKLLHKQLNRYRLLAQELQTILATTQEQAAALCALLVEESGQILISSGSIDDNALEQLGELIVRPPESMPPTSLQPTQEDLSESPPEQTHYGIYVASAIEDVYLALLSPPQTSLQMSKRTWDRIETAALDTMVAFHQYSHKTNSAEMLTQEKRFIPLNLEVAAAVGGEADNNQPRINWALIPDKPAAVTRGSSQEDEDQVIRRTFMSETSVLKRLDHFCRVD